MWAFDRALRIGRLALLNLPSFKASAKYNAEADVIRVEVPVRSGIRPRPGTYYFVYTMNGLKFWESHPFTLSSWNLGPTSATTQASADTGASTRTLSFIIRPYDSFTKRLRNSILSKQHAENGASNSDTPIRMVVEGPYGSQHDLRHYNSALLVVGGMGITVALGHLHALNEALNKNEPVPLTRVHLVWAVRDVALFRDVYEHELAPWLSSSRLAGEIELRVDIYVTQNSEKMALPEMAAPLKTSEDDSAGTKITNAEISLKQEDNSQTSSVTGDDAPSTVPTSFSIPSNVTIFKNRPFVHDVVLESAQSGCSGGQKLAVVCCGPGSMADDTRAAVVRALAHGHDGLDFYPESFNW